MSNISNAELNVLKNNANVKLNEIFRNYNKNNSSNNKLENSVNTFKNELRNFDTKNIKKPADIKKTKDYLHKLIGELLELKKSKDISTNDMSNKLNKIMTKYEKFKVNSNVNMILNEENNKNNRNLNNIMNRMNNNSNKNMNRNMNNDMNRMNNNSNKSMNMNRMNNNSNKNMINSMKDINSLFKNMDIDIEDINKKFNNNSNKNNTRNNIRNNTRNNMSIFDEEKLTEQPLIDLANRIKETTELEDNKNKLYNNLDKIKKDKNMNLQRGRNVVKKLYDFIISVNNSFNVPREERVSYINNLVDKLNEDKYFLESLNVILSGDDKNMLDEPLDVLEDKSNKVSIKNKLQTFQKVSRQNANSRLTSFLQRNFSSNKNMNKNMNKNNSRNNSKNMNKNMNKNNSKNNKSVLSQMLF